MRVLVVHQQVGIETSALQRPVVLQALRRRTPQIKLAKAQQSWRLDLAHVGNGAGVPHLLQFLGRGCAERGGEVLVGTDAKRFHEAPIRNVRGGGHGCNVGHGVPNDAALEHIGVLAKEMRGEEAPVRAAGERHPLRVHLARGLRGFDSVNAVLDVLRPHPPGQALQRTPPEASAPPEVHVKDCEATGDQERVARNEDGRGAAVRAPMRYDDQRRRLLACWRQQQDRFKVVVSPICARKRRGDRQNLEGSPGQGRALELLDAIDVGRERHARRHGRLRGNLHLAGNVTPARNVLGQELDASRRRGTGALDEEASLAGS
eukprot:scaffold146_cov265-Pinguiococcus_pyrenoidosus.AAC.39